MQLILYNIILIIHHTYQCKKKIAIIEIYCIIATYNDNTCYLIIIIKPQIYIVKHVYLSGLNFYLDIADLYTRFNTDFVFPKTEEYSCH